MYIYTYVHRNIHIYNVCVCVRLVMNCRAYTKYRQRSTWGLSTLPHKSAPRNPLHTFFSRHRGSIDIPLEMRAPQTVYIDGRHYSNKPRLRRISRLYFRSILMLWQFAYGAYKLSEMRDDFIDTPLDQLLFNHWAPSYAGSILFTENGQKHVLLLLLHLLLLLLLVLLLLSLLSLSLLLQQKRRMCVRPYVCVLLYRAHSRDKRCIDSRRRDSSRSERLADQQRHSGEITCP